MFVESAVGVIAGATGVSLSIVGVSALGSTELSTKDGEFGPGFGCAGVAVEGNGVPCEAKSSAVGVAGMRLDGVLITLPPPTMGLAGRRSVVGVAA